MSGSPGQECSWASRKAESPVWVLLDSTQPLSARLFLLLSPTSSMGSLPSSVLITGLISVTGQSTAPSIQPITVQPKWGVRSHLFLWLLLLLSALEFPEKHRGLDEASWTALYDKVSLKGAWLLPYGTFSLNNSFFRLERNNEDDKRSAICLLLG